MLEMVHDMEFLKKRLEKLEDEPKRFQAKSTCKIHTVKSISFLPKSSLNLTNFIL